VAQHPKCSGQVGAVGFCLGGGLSVWAATVNPKVGAVTTFYYVMPHGKPDFSQLDAPVLGHFGTGDDFVSVDDAKALEEEIREKGGGEVEFVFYDGAGHAFFAWYRPNYRPEQAVDGWTKVFGFFRRHLTAAAAARAA
jgi:carboxymethylenebutenolidase